MYLVRHHQKVVYPATTSNFKLGYFSKGRENKKFYVKDSVTLEQAYNRVKDGQLNLWIDPHAADEDLQCKKSHKKRKRRKMQNPWIHLNSSRVALPDIYFVLQIFSLLYHLWWRLLSFNLLATL